MDLLIKTKRALWCGGLGLLLGCDAGTGGGTVTVEFSLGSSAEATMLTDTGWSVTLQQACVALGPVYLFENAPLAELDRGLLRRAYDWLVPTAHAHAGDQTFAGGAVKAEWVEQIAFNVLGAPFEAGRIHGIAGPARSFAVRLDPPRGALTDDACLRGHHAFVIGHAEKDGVRIAFEGGLDIPEEGLYRRVEGLSLDADLSDHSRISVSVQPTEWFRYAHFDRLEQRAESGRYAIEKDSQVWAAWLHGARSASAFVAVHEEIDP